jgi:hypothetical protein
LPRVEAPQKRLVWFEHSAHMPMTEDPASFSSPWCVSRDQSPQKRAMSCPEATEGRNIDFRPSRDKWRPFRPEILDFDHKFGI